MRSPMKSYLVTLISCFKNCALEYGFWGLLASKSEVGTAPLKGHFWSLPQAAHADSAKRVHKIRHAPLKIRDH